MTRYGNLSALPIYGLADLPTHGNPTVHRLTYGPFNPAALLPLKMLRQPANLCWMVYQRHDQPKPNEGQTNLVSVQRKRSSFLVIVTNYRTRQICSPRPKRTESTSDAFARQNRYLDALAVVARFDQHSSNDLRAIFYGKNHALRREQRRSRDNRSPDGIAGCFVARDLPCEPMQTIPNEEML